MLYFVPVGFIGVVGIQVENPRGNPHEKYRGVSKGGCDKEQVHLFISGIQKFCIL